MIKSMTGYGKADVCLDTGKVTIEIRTLNGKTADVNIKTTLLPKDKELLVRQKLADRLHRGTIDFFVSYEANAVSSAKHINTEMAAEYFRQVAAIGESLGVKTDSALYLNSILRFPDVIDNTRQDIITADNWDQVDAAVDKAIDNVCDYRSREGVALYKDVTSRVQNILNLEDKVESFDGERILAVRSKIEKAIEDLLRRRIGPLGTVAFLAARNAVPPRRFPSTCDRHHMIHGQGSGTDLAMAIVAFAPLKLGAPPFCLPQFPRPCAFAPHVLRIRIQVKPFAIHRDAPQCSPSAAGSTGGRPVRTLNE